MGLAKFLSKQFCTRFTTVKREGNRMTHTRCYPLTCIVSREMSGNNLQTVPAGIFETFTYIEIL